MGIQNVLSSASGTYYSRPALERLLQEQTGRNVILINAPSGAGKTAVIAHFTDAAPNDVCWFNIEPGDSDPAAFLARYRQTIEQHTGQPISFPPFAADYLARIEVYGEQLISLLLHHLGSTITLVFDDCHLLQADSPVQTLLRLFSSQLLEGQQMIALSRMPVPFPRKDWDSERRILRLDWGHFQLSANELAQLFQHMTGELPHEKTLGRLMQQTGGLIADILLLAGKNDHENVAARSKTASTHDFIEQGLELDDVDWGQLCLLAEFSVLNEEIIHAICPGSRLIEILGHLAEGGRLVQRIQQDPPIFRLHDLMRKHLRRKRADLLSHDLLKQHLNEVATLLLNAGQDYAAMRLQSQTGSLDQVAATIRDRAMDWIQRGRYYTLRQMLSLLEGSEYEALPWMRFFQGALCKFLRPDKAIVLFQMALDGFEREADITGEKMALGELLDTIQYHGEDFSIATPLLERAWEHIENTPPAQAGLADALLATYAGVMFLLHKGESLKALQCVSRSSQIAAKLPGLELLSSYLHVYHAIASDSAGLCRQAAASFDQAEALFARSPEHPPHRFMYNFLASVHEIFFGQYSASLQRMLETLKYSQQWGLQHHQEHLLTRIAESHLGLGNPEPVAGILAQVDAIPHRSGFSRGIMLQVQAHYWLEKDQPYEALQAAKRSAAELKRIGAEIFHRSTLSLQSVALTELEQYEQAARLQADNLSWADRVGSKMQRFTTLLHQAWRHFRQDQEEDMLNALHAALEIGARHGFLTSLHWTPHIMSRLLSIALGHDMESIYVRSLITMHDLTPPEAMSSTEAWPWRVRIRCLGESRIVINDKEVPPNTWKGGKTLALLEALLAGGGEHVAVDRLIDVLWPDTEGDKARQNLEFTLRGLRKVLSLPNIKSPLVRLKAGRLSLDPHYCWIDTRAFLELQRTADRHDRAGDAYMAISCREQAIALYRGPLLAGRDTPWILEHRRQWRQRFFLMVGKCRDQLRQQNEEERFAVLARQALAAEPDSQSIHTDIYTYR